MHLHYSPFQFANDVQATDGEVSLKRILKENKKLTKKDAKQCAGMKCTISREDAHEIIFNSSPTAFISPNPVGAMRDIKSVFGC